MSNLDVYEKQEDREAKKLLYDLWPNYLNHGYFDSSGNLLPEFVDREKVIPLVKAFSKPHYNSHGKLEYFALTNSQLRRFFQHARGIETILKNESKTWEGVFPEFRKLDIAAADAYGKEKGKIPPIFHLFMKLNTSIVKTKVQFMKGFIPHFEAIVGFSSGILKERD